MGFKYEYYCKPHFWSKKRKLSKKEVEENNCENCWNLKTERVYDTNCKNFYKV